MTPLVSIIIPCHNAAPWLEQTLRSALAQNWPETEIIVVDDGSTDESPAIARSFESRGVRLLTQSTRGAAAARNAGLAAARGDFIQFLDADDLIDPDKIARQMERLAQEPDGTAAMGAWGRFRSDPAEASFRPEPPWRDWDDPADFLRLLYRDHRMMHPACWLLPREIVRRAGPWDESLSLNDDGEYFCRVALAASRLAFCPEAKVRYRSYVSGSLSRRDDPAACRSLLKSFELCSRHLLARSNTPETRQALANAFQRLEYELYPAARPLSRIARQRADELGGSRAQPMMGARSRMLARIVGWRAVFWLVYCRRHRHLPPSVRPLAQENIGLRGPTNS